jgi:hypothetical protein
MDSPVSVFNLKCIENHARSYVEKNPKKKEAAFMLAHA